MRNKKLIIYIFISLFIVFPRVSHGATLYSQAANQDVYAGQTFVLDWYLDTENTSVNALDLSLNFSPETLEVTNISSGNSLINLWIKNPTFDNAQGKISLTGGIANGATGKFPVFRVSFHAKKAGPAFIKLDTSSQVLLNDGAGTSSLLKFRDETFNIYPENFVPLLISSSTHPDPNSWYQNRDVSINFAPKDGTDYSYSFSSNAEIIPENQVLAVPAEISYQNLPDGIYYFKVNSKTGTNAWSEAGVFRVQIDATPPEDFTPLIGSDAGINGGKKFVSFSTLDKTSGISHYKVELGRFQTQETTDLRVNLPKLVIGKSITVVAFDLAGNQKTETINYDGGVSPIWFYGIIGLIILLLGAIVRYKFKSKPKNEEIIG